MASSSRRRRGSGGAANGGGGGGGAVSSQVQSEALPLGTLLNADTMRQIDFEVRTNGFLSALLQKISRRVFAGGISLQLNVGRRSVDMQPETAAFLERFWLPVLEATLLNVQKYGVAPIVYVPHRMPNGDTVVLPTVPHEGTYDIRFVVTDHGALEFTLYRRERVSYFTSGRGGGLVGTASRGAAARLLGGVGGAAAGGQPVPWPNSRVLHTSRFLPDVAGNLGSILVKTLPYLVSLRNLRENYDAATHEAARPPYVQVRAAARGGGSDKNVPGPDDIPFGDSDFALGGAAERTEMNDEQRAELARARSAAAASNAPQYRHTYDAATATARLTRVQDAWLARKLDLPEGTSLSGNVPVPATPAGYEAVQDQLMRIVSNMLEVSEDVGTGATQKFSGNADFAQRQFNDLVSSYQQMLKPFGEQIYRDIYAEDQARFFEGAVSAYEGFVGGGGDDDVDDSGDGGGDAGFLSEEQLRRVSGAIRVEMVFNNVPHVTFEKLREYYLDDLITYEQYRQQALALANLPEEESGVGTYASERAVKLAHDTAAATAAAAPAGTAGTSGGGTAAATTDRRDTTDRPRRSTVQVQASAAAASSRTIVDMVDRIVNGEPGARAPPRNVLCLADMFYLPVPAVRITAKRKAGIYPGGSNGSPKTTRGDDDDDDDDDIAEIVDDEDGDDDDDTISGRAKHRGVKRTRTASPVGRPVARALWTSGETAAEAAQRVHSETSLAADAERAEDTEHDSGGGDGDGDGGGGDHSDGDESTAHATSPMPAAAAAALAAAEAAGGDASANSPVVDESAQAGLSESAPE